MTTPMLKINALIDGATKDAEIAFLEKVAGMIPEGSYLASLFSEALVTWTAKLIRDDVCPDVMNLVSELRTSDAEAQRKVYELQAIIKTNADLAFHQETEYQRELKHLRQQVGEEQGHRGELWSSWCEDRERLAEREAQLEKAEAKVAALKARLFDIEHPELA